MWPRLPPKVFLTSQGTKGEEVGEVRATATREQVGREGSQRQSTSQSGRPSSAALPRTNPPHRAIPSKSSLSAQKVKETNPPEDLKFWLECATPKDNLLETRRWAGTCHAPLSPVPACAGYTHAPKLPPKCRHSLSHVAIGRLQVCPSLTIPTWRIS